MRIRSTSWLLALVMIVSLVTPAFAASEPDVPEPVEPAEAPAAESFFDEASAAGQQYWDDLTWTVENGVLTISGTGDMTDYCYDHYYAEDAPQAPWQSLSDSVRKIVVEDGVTSIGQEAFYGFASVTEIVLADSITTIGARAFYNCGAISVYNVPTGLVSVDAYAFVGCSPEVINAFRGAGGGPALMSGWQLIGDFWYYYDTDGSRAVGLRYIDNAWYFFREDGVMAADEFVAIDGETYYFAPDGAGSPTVCGDDLTWAYADGVLTISGTGDMWDFLSYHYYEEDDPGIPWQSFKDSITEVVIGDGVTGVGREAFYDCGALTSVTLPDSVASIGEHAFYNCELLTDIDRPAALASVGEYSFLHCPLATVVRMCGELTGSCGDEAAWTLDGDGVLTITGTGAMYAYDASRPEPWQEYRDDITALVVEEGVTYLACVCEYCGGLKTVALPQSLTEIESHAFENCTALTDVYYGGSPAQWRSIMIGHHNDPLDAASLHCAIELTAYAVVPATCEENGHTAYWYDSATGKYFADANAATEITQSSTVIRATGHSWDSGKVEVEPTCTEDGLRVYTCRNDNSHHYTAVIEALGHDLEHVAAQPSTKSAEGHTEYWICARCKTVFSDAAGKNEITLASTVIRKMGWYLNSVGWWYQNADGTWPADEWLLDEGKWYHFDSRGYMQTYWQLIGGNWYHFAGSGAMMTGLQKIANTWFYFNASGVMQTGWQKIGGSWYCFNDLGYMLTYWQKLGNHWYYFGENGVMQTGWQKPGGVWYYFNELGAMQTGWQEIGGSWYYFNDAGAMLTDWQQIDGKWYYFNALGAMQTGWQELGGKWFFFSTSGVMQTSWLRSGSSWYYFGDSGAMRTDWQEIGGKWYYFNERGVMQTGWISSGGAWYYMNDDGVMQTGWLRSGSSWYYLKTNGRMATGWLQLSGVWYWFNDRGVMAANQTVTIGGTAYTFAASGAWIA